MRSYLSQLYVLCFFPGPFIEPDVQWIFGGGFDEGGPAEYVFYFSGLGDTH